MGDRDYIITTMEVTRIDELCKFMGDSGFLWRDKKLLAYLLILSSDISDNTIVLFKNKIVGCNLYISTKACINGSTRTIKWSHSTYLSPEHRRHVGIDMLFESVTRKDIWGFGLTKINNKIHRLSGSIFCKPSQAYICDLTPDKISRKNRKSKFPKEFICNGRKFKRCMFSTDHKMPNSGIWNGDCLNVDFIRDCDFMQKRFYGSNRSYWIYKVVRNTEVDELYFVVKEIYSRDKLILFLVDYRFKFNETDSFKAILNALNYLVRNNEYDAIFVTTTFNAEDILSEYGYCKYGDSSSIVTNSPEAYNDMQLMVTPADSDCELIPSN